MLRGIVSTALAVALSAPAVHAAPPAQAPTTVWLAEKVSAHAPSVTLHAYFRWDIRGARVSYAGVAMVAGRPRPTGGLTWDAPLFDGPAAHHDGTVAGCPASSSCDLLTGPGVAYFGLTYPPSSPQPDRIYLVLSGLSQDVSLEKSPGWRLRRTRLTARFATSDSPGTVATGARMAGEVVERFTHASIAGGRRGSIAIATPPCRPLHRVGYLREGYGTATLSGGTRQATFDCQKNLSDLTAAADRATTWSFDGPVVGTATGTTRITVIDL